MDFVPGIPNNFRPNFRDRCWFDGNMIYLLYFHGVAITSFISSICLCICAAQKIAYYEKDIAHHLKDSENRCYNNNKQWFKLHLEMTKVLFIIICIKWYMYAIQVLNDESSLSVWYVYCALEVIEHFCIFLIFVWKKRIRQLLLKRFGWQNCNMFSITQH